MMDIVIPTYRRTTRQHTLGRFIPPNWWTRTYLVVDAQDADEFLKNPHRMQPGVILVVHPPSITTIAAKRAWIIRTWGAQGKAVLMCDDDLRFCSRPPTDTEDTHLHIANHVETGYWLSAMENKLETYVHGGFVQRQGNNNIKGNGTGWIQTGRNCYAVGYDCPTLMMLEKDEKIELGRIPLREDMDLTLQLLGLGLDNATSYAFCTDQIDGFGAAGGCSDERTMEFSDEMAIQLAELHPKYVTVVKKEYKVGKVGTTRLEVRVQWKKCFNDAVNAQISQHEDERVAREEAGES